MKPFLTRCIPELKAINFTFVHNRFCLTVQFQIDWEKEAKIRESRCQSSDLQSYRSCPECSALKATFYRHSCPRLLPLCIYFETYEHKRRMNDVMMSNIFQEYVMLCINRHIINHFPRQKLIEWLWHGWSKLTMKNLIQRIHLIWIN